jgi:DNA (cytosine-5)-methyltransferase 1
MHHSEYYPAVWHENKAGNISSYPYSCALRAGASYNYLLVNGERRLTPREMLRLQGFPDSFEIVVSDCQTRKQAGNAVPVDMIKLVLDNFIPLVFRQ